MAKARELFKQGIVAYMKGDYAAARQHFEQAQALVPRPQVLFNLVRVAEKQGDRKAACNFFTALMSSKLDARMKQTAATLAHVCRP
jgi:Flp pilus assembly protein TadD